MGQTLSYSEGTTAMHRANPLAKLALALCFCIAAFATENLALLAALIALDVVMGFAGGIGERTLRLLAGLAGVCAFLFVLQLLFVRAGTPVFLFATDQGVKTASLVALRLMAATMPLATMLALTSANDLANELVKKARVPYSFAFALTTALRFIPLFADEMKAIMEAQTARGVEFDATSPVKRLRLAVPLCAPMLVTSVGRVGQSALAAETRGFYLRARKSGYKDMPFSAVDALVLAASVCVVAAGFLL